MKVKSKIGTRKMRKDTEAAKRIRALRGRFTQAEFAKALHVAQPMVSAWEAGRELPASADLWLKFGEYAGWPDCFWFWQRAGLVPNTLLAAAQKALNEQIKDGTSGLDGQMVLVPRVRKTAQGLEVIGEPLLMPAERIPNPLSTQCFVLEGIEAVVDTTEAGAPTLLPFLGRIVLLDVEPYSGIASAPFIVGLHVGILFGPVESRGPEETTWGLQFVPLRQDSIGDLYESQTMSIGVAPYWVGSSRSIKLTRPDQNSLAPNPESVGAPDTKALKRLSEEADAILRKMDRQIKEELRLFPRCKIIGRVIAQFPIPKTPEGRK